MIENEGLVISILVMVAYFVVGLFLHEKNLRDCAFPAVKRQSITITVLPSTDSTFSRAE
jgi:hypothetical protein